MATGEQRPRLICRCLGVASPRVYAAVRAGRLATVAEITKAVRAGGGCGLCHPELEEVLAELRGEPADPALALENQAICREETHARVSAAIEALVRPRLRALGVALTDYVVKGLVVRVALDAAHGEALAIVRAQLRGAVCPDLEVELLQPAGRVR